jgi:nucleotide-binding universal stress UspA family protein
MTRALGHSRTFCIACDLSESSLKAVEWVKCTLVEPNDAIILVHVRKPFQSFDLDLLEQYKRRGQEVMDIMKKFKMYFSGNLVEIKILYGEARDKILDYVEAINPTLLVVGARGLSIKKRILGSTSEYLAINSKIPVLVCRYS